MNNVQIDGLSASNSLGSKDVKHSKTITQSHALCGNPVIILAETNKISANSPIIKIAYFTSESYVASWSTNTEDTMKLVVQVKQLSAAA